MFKNKKPEFYTTIEIDGVHFECGYDVCVDSVYLLEVNLVGSKYDIYQFLANDIIKDLENDIKADRSPRIVEDYDHE
jgi:hypothetical protein